MSSPEFYREARAYDIAFSDRDFVDECNFLEWCLRTHGDVSGPLSCLELAAGPARHAREFSRRGWRALALDLSQDMLDYAADGARLEGTPIETVLADMTDFTLKQPVALTMNLMESLSHLTTNTQVVAHLRAVAKNLLPGGVLVIEMAHPDSIWRDSLPNTWQSRSTDTQLFNNTPYTEVDVLFGSEHDPFDWVTQQWIVTTRLDIKEEGQPPRVIEQHYPHRWYLAQELQALIDLSGAFEKVWWYGNMLVPPPPFDSSPDSDRMIIVLRKGA
jgi:SAM-dependent methyltransferase